MAPRFPVPLPTMLVLTLSLWTGAANAVAGTEFYSWIDASGTMVMTDDPGQIPPAAARSPVSIHRYEPQVMPDISRHARRKATTSDREPAPAPKESRTETPSKSDAVAQAETESAPVVLDLPDGPGRNQYLWIPLVSPVYLGGNMVAGFWSHRSVSSPVDAFTRFMAKQNWPKQPILIGGGHIQLGNVFNTPGTSTTPSTGRPGGQSMTPVHDQVMRERQALIERTFPPARSSQPQRSTGSTSSLRGGHGAQLR